MRTFNDMNDLYNGQGVILSCEIIENRYGLMHHVYRFNPRKCNSATSLSSCIERNLSKVIIALPTSNTVVEIFEKIITGGFSGVKTRLGLDTKVLMPNNTQSQYEKKNIDQSFKSYKMRDLKVGYKLKLDGKDIYSNRPVISKILKLNENIQYGYAMAKCLRWKVSRECSCSRENKLWENVFCTKRCSKNVFVN